MCKLSVLFFSLWFFSYNTNFACHEYGEWYVMCPKPIKGPLLAGKKELENEVKIGAGYRNLLRNENNDILYINNLFPVTLHPSALDLAKIFKKKEVLTEDESEKIRNSVNVQNGSEGVAEYINALEKFIDLIIAYLGIWIDKGTSVEVFEKIKKNINETFRKNGDIQGLVLSIEEVYFRDKNVRKLVHTERLLIFDEYFYVDKNEKGEVVFPFFPPLEPLVFVSRLDMCESCEKIMIDLLGAMPHISPNEFSGPFGTSVYKILAGSFFSGKNNSENIKSGNGELLKVRLAPTPTAVASTKNIRPSSTTTGKSSQTLLRRASSTSELSRLIVVPPAKKPSPADGAVSQPIEKTPDPFGKP